MTSRPIILHISSDYPDAMAPDKTRAVSGLVDGTPEFRHVVYSLNRVDGWSGTTSLPFGEDRIAVAYKALPKGLLWDSRLAALGDWILADLNRRAIVPDLIEAHKFTVEGLIGLQLAEAFGKPLICDIQGDSDTNILNRKPGLRPRYRAIAARTAVVFPFAPWPVAQFETMTGLDRAKCRILPVVPGIDALRASAPVSAQRLVTVFNADSWQRKNIVRVAQAMKLVAAQFPGVTLDVYGRGRPGAILAMRDAVAETGIGDRLAFKGSAANGSLPDILNGYAAFVLPSLRETYGLVYAEALFAGLPLLFSKNRGIDGLLETNAIGYACDPHSVEDIAAGIHHLLTSQAALKTDIARLQAEGGIDILRRESILRTYRQGIKDALL